jgi:hypothetical protein
MSINNVNPNQVGFIIHTKSVWFDGATIPKISEASYEIFENLGLAQGMKWKHQAVALFSDTYNQDTVEINRLSRAFQGLMTISVTLAAFSVIFPQNFVDFVMFGATTGLVGAYLDSERSKLVKKYDEKLANFYRSIPELAVYYRINGEKLNSDLNDRIGSADADQLKTLNQAKEELTKTIEFYKQFV